MAGTLVGLLSCCSSHSDSLGAKVFDFPWVDSFAAADQDSVLIGGWLL